MKTENHKAKVLAEQICKFCTVEKLTINDILSALDIVTEKYRADATILHGKDNTKDLANLKVVIDVDDTALDEAVERAKELVNILDKCSKLRLMNF